MQVVAKSVAPAEDAPSSYGQVDYQVADCSAVAVGDVGAPPAQFCLVRSVYSGKEATTAILKVTQPQQG